MMDTDWAREEIARNLMVAIAVLRVVEDDDLHPLMGKLVDALASARLLGCA